MLARTMVAALAVLMAVALVACGQPATTPDPAGPPSADDPAAGSRLAPGLYDIEGDRAQAVGTLRRVEIEGGFWAIASGEAADSEDTSDIVAVIANGDEFAEQLRGLEGSSVIATGERFEGASIRMAGPEIVIDEITAMDDTPGIAE